LAKHYCLPLLKEYFDFIMLLSNEKFREYLFVRFDDDFESVVPDKDVCDLFADVSKYIDTDIYTKLLSFVDLYDYNNFQRFFFVSIRNHFDKDYVSCSLENIKTDPSLQVICLVCLQYYFL
jgi:hypothetical protein